MDAKAALGEPTATISRSALLHNAALIRAAVAPQVKVCAIVKADAYGHGASIVADTLANFSNSDSNQPAVDAFAVADLDEAAALPITTHPILILRPIENAFLGKQRARIEQAIRAGWWLTVASPTAADDIARIALTTGKRANLHVMIDTGMSRVGVRPEQLADLLQRIDSRPSLKLCGIYTHFVASEDADHPMNIEQLATFLDVTEVMREGRGKLFRHAANSGGVFFTQPAHLDMVRPGISLYGVDPTGLPSVDRPLKPVMKWTAPLIGVRTVRKGESVGYNQTWIAKQDTRVGLVPVGYADGYSRAYSNRAITLIHDCPAPVIGRVSMDLTTIDLNQVPIAEIGDEVTLMDDNPLSQASIYKLAEWAGTISYEIFCGIGPRVKRIAVDPSDALEQASLSDESAE